MGTLCAQLLLQFYANSFETSQMFGSWSENVLWFGYPPQIIISLFSQVELSHFSGVFTIKVNG